MSVHENNVSEIGGIAAYAERALGFLAAASYRRPVATLAILGAITLAALFAASTLKVDADLAGLLPKHFQSIRDMDALHERFGSTGWVTVVARDAEPEQLIRFVDDLAPVVGSLPQVNYVDFKRGSKFFEDRKLYFIEVGDLEIIKRRISDRLEFERNRHNPLFFDLGDDPPPLDFSDIEAKYTGEDKGGTWLQTQTRGTYYLNPEERIIVMQIRPDRPTIDLAYTRQLLTDIEAKIASLDIESYGAAMKVSLGGRYKQRVVLQETIEGDMQMVSLFATLAMLLYLAIHFRRVLAVLLIMLPLIMGLSWCFAFAALAFDTLNILTAFIGVILLGLGIDHGIHLLGRFEYEHGQTADADTAVRTAFARTGRAVLVAAITTMVAFLCLAISDFRAFYEFGIIAGSGMALVVLAYSSCLPALLGAALRLGWRPRVMQEEGSPSAWPRFLLAHRRRLLAGAAVGIGLAIILAPGVSFNYDFAALDQIDDETQRLNGKVDEILGFPDGPVAILTPSLEEERHLVEELRRLKAEKKGDSTIRMVAASADLMPPNQPEKQKVIAEIAAVVDGINPQTIAEAKARAQFVELTELVKAQPFTRDDLPRQVKLLFGGESSGEAGFVLVFPAIGRASGVKILEYAEDLRSVRKTDGTAPPVAGEDIILADILRMVIDEALPIALFTILMVFLTLWALLTRLGDVALCLIPPVLTLIITLALMSLSTVQANYLNIVMFPVIFGIGVDGGAHLVTRLTRGERFSTVVAETGRAVAGAILTTGLGFGALTMANHNGLNSIGNVALLGLAANLLICLVAFPPLLALRFAKGE